MPKLLALRRLRRGEKQKLERKARDRRLTAGVSQRYRLIALVYAGLSVWQAAQHLKCAKETAYHWVHEFNAQGFCDFERASNPHGRPSQLKPRHLRALLAVAQQRPTEVGLPFTNWSIAKLREYLVKRGRIPARSAEWLRRVLHRAGISWQRTKTWKQSSDPAFASKKSVFWRYMPNGQRTAWWSAMTNSVHWNYGHWPASAGPSNAGRSACARPIRGAMALNNCMVSMMYTRTAWSDRFGDARRPVTSPLALLTYAAVIRSRYVFMWCLTISKPTCVLPTISFLVITWRRFICQPTLLG